MRHFGFLLSVLFLVITVRCSFAQKIDTHQLSSEFLEGERTVQVWLPEGYNPQEKYATLYVFDAAYLFNATCAVAEFEMMYKKIPPAIVVGVHFKKGQRNFDMGINWFTDGKLNTNGKNFYRYVKSELIPFIKENYSTSGHSTVIGHSNSSTFANYFLFDEERPVFTNYITLSQVFVGNAKQDFTRLFSQTLNRPHYYFVGIAEKDSSNRIDNPRETQKLLGTITPTKNFNPHFQTFDSADHGTIFIRGLPVALEYVFQDFPPLSNQWNFDSEQRTFVHPKSGLNIAEYFDQRKTDPLDYVIENRKMASALFGVDLKPTVHDMSFVASYGIYKKDEEFLDRVIGYFENEYPDNELLLQWAGQEYRAIGAWEKAEAYFWKFNELPNVKGKRAFAYNYLFQTFDYYKKDPDKAWELLGKYKKAFPNSNRVDQLYGKISVDYNYKLDEGEKALLRFLENTTGNQLNQEQGNLLLGNLYKLQKKTNLAKMRFNRVLKINPNSKEAKQALAELDGADQPN